MCKVLAVIPARGGSKGLPRKNILPLAGKPLLAWSIEAALGATCVTNCIVSSDSAEILDVAEEYGARAIKRPDYLASDRVTNAIVVENLLAELMNKGERFDTVILLQPTSPLRTSQDIDSAFSLFLAKGLACCVSVTHMRQSPFFSFTLAEDARLSRIIPGAFSTQRQTRPKAFAPNGAIYIASTDWFMRNETFFPEEGVGGYVMPFERSVDIDTVFDMRMAEFVLLCAENKPIDRIPND